MIRVTHEGTILRVYGSKNEKIGVNKAKRLLRSGIRIMNQNPTKSIIIELDTRTKIDHTALRLIEKTFEKLDDCCLVMIGC